jgi:hypothetical protein
MTFEGFYSASMAFVLVGWAALLAAPWKRAMCIIVARSVALILALTYVYQLLFTTVSVPSGNFTTLAGVTALFSLAPNVMLGWSHYLVFDLFVGSWEVEDAGRRGLSHFWVAPCLILTLMVGPVGLMVYFIVRTIAVKAKQA